MLVRKLRHRDRSYGLEWGCSLLDLSEFQGVNSLVGVDRKSLLQHAPDAVICGVCHSAI